MFSNSQHVCHACNLFFELEATKHCVLHAFQLITHLQLNASLPLHWNRCVHITSCWLKNIHSLSLHCWPSATVTTGYACGKTTQKDNPGAKKNHSCTHPPRNQGTLAGTYMSLACILLCMRHEHILLLAVLM